MTCKVYRGRVPRRQPFRFGHGAAPEQPPFPLPDEETIARRRAEIRDECAAIRREAA